ncbi:MAG: hydrogenase nickel incorporation protein HypB [Thermodesulfovibrionales bacterium]|nr:hydrogenase nickel incorporation protein HypB [Thermodesulfovibrionales bacterium]
MKINVVSKILEANERLAADNGKLFDSHGLFVINLMSAPGAGKTTLLTKTIKELKGDLRMGVVEGDIQGTYDAEQIGALNVPVVQINTGGACHLDANMISEAVKDLPLADLDVLIIENVGNLVCPAEFNVGEHVKIMLLSLTEGHDKPLKYPLMFQESSALVVNKIDLKPYVDADPEKIRRDALSLNPQLKIFEVSCKSGQGIGEWTSWLKELCGSHKNNP